VYIFLNGEFLLAEAAKISVFDGGYMYGDGIYTTMRLYRGLPLDLVAHHDRLRDHSGQMQIPFHLSCAQLRTAIAELVERNNMSAGDGRLRITISRRGDPDNPLPLNQLEQTEATVVMTLAPINPTLSTWQAEGIPVICLDATFARGNFPKLKTLNSLATITALREAAAAGCPEALLSNAQGFLLEGAVSNVFMVVEGTLFTPSHDGAFLAGRTRERIFDIAKQEDIAVEETQINRKELDNAQELFVVSSVREVLPVISVDDKLVGRGVPGAVTKLIQEKYRQLIEKELG